MRTAAVIAMVVALGCGGGGGADAGVAIDAPDQGTISFQWSLTTPDAQALECADVAAISVSVTATPAIGGFGQIDAFNCTQGSATTRPLDPATYNLTFEIAATGGELAADVVMNGITVTAGQDNDVGAVTFEIEPSGGFHFTVDAGTPTNCEATDAGGAGITALEMQLVDADSVCVPTDFCIGDDSAAGCQGTTYSNDCAGATTACIADDVLVRVEGALSGAHQLQITGYRDLESCYSRASQIQIPGNNLDRDLGSQLLALTCGVDAAP